ncbi:MAG: dihydrofolate synthase / folylpolyglutamate synthase [Petroclostridium sp.]|jgi:dihydrofolate synthase/folylpolyglutamate synthase|uniref:bifunctional folylpolyglutamate synthase/dihydrofolate synthase n=1 Tax=Petroclostridium xylanilyticum TaxID=1792311 RepID=UPI000B9997EA|nr:folylpolyglutamate synthase/dihydrofolate synthase family protein [Petroclostridium xylanilyticum]MBZ4644675.1 bifunctional folylpolyglutamate synthase/dihydrofolate synthase [Clostridia bacterium]MDK2810540.1 dihydrofolate synthase / folylpolyglutamate synthase [Petroclostridium sp.]
MNYEEALAYIHGTLKFGSKLGLDNIANLLRRMGDPHKKLKYIHIAGTNGKGSTTAMIASILTQAGYKTGMYTSPYLEEFTERIQINGQNIDKQHLADITSRIKELVKEMVDQGYNHPTEFEIVTAIAFQYYYEQKCDFVVLEVGMGGRFDATNVIETSLVSVITSISMDHMDKLGDTIEKIAFEKSGIIKENGLVVVYPEQEPGVIEVIEKVAKEKKAEVLKADQTSVKIISDTLQGTEFSFSNYTGLRMYLLGEHQVLNAGTAITVIEILKSRYGITISDEDIRAGMENVRWPGRFEIIGTNPLFIIDGAHNISGVSALKRAIHKYLTNKRITFIVGMLRDKEYGKCIPEIASRAELLIATCPQSERALAAEELGEISRRYCDKVIVEADIKKAIQLAMDRTEEDGVICCCGSLYLIGIVRKFLKESYK